MFTEIVYSDDKYTSIEIPIPTNKLLHKVPFSYIYSNSNSMNILHTFKY